MPSNPLASQHQLYQEIVAKAGVLPDIGGKLRAAFQAITVWIIAGGRSLVDTPAERQQLESIAVQAVNSLIVGTLGPANAIAVEAIVDPLVVSAIEMAIKTLLVPAPLPIPSPPAPETLGASH